MSRDDAYRTIRMLYTGLTVGLALVGAIFFALRRLLVPVGASDFPAVLFSILSITELGVALTFLRRRIPERRFDESAQVYWSRSDVRSSSTLLWGTIEGGGLFALVGYLLTGAIIPATVGFVALGALVAFRPTVLAGDPAA